MIDARDVGAPAPSSPTAFYYDKAARLIGKERGKEGGNDPLFVFVYTAANHFPVGHPLPSRPDAEMEAAQCQFRNRPEYVRRRRISARDYAAFVARLKRDIRTRRS